MNSRERLRATLNHQSTDRVCVDFGATAVTGMHASVLHRLRQAVLGDKNHRVKVIEPYQMLGEMDDALRDALGIDVAGICGRTTMFGFENRDWKEFTMFDGTPVLVPAEFRVVPDATGDLLIYPEGDTSAPPSGRMPKGGCFFDAIIRQEPIDEEALNPADNAEDFQVLSAADLDHYRQAARQLSTQTTCGIAFWVPGAGFGDIAQVPAVARKHPKGIRDVAEWYMSTALRRDYVYQVYEAQCQVAEQNILLLAAAIGDQADAAIVTGTDFGTQRGLLISRAAYRDLYQPFHTRLNRLIHGHTRWKTMIHTCGAVAELIPDLIEAGFDILNPVQTAATGMDPRRLKTEFGDQLVFWGGGVDTQGCLAHDGPEEVYRQVRERIDIFNERGGFVFNAIHNIQANTRIENLQALFRAVADSARE